MRKLLLCFVLSAVALMADVTGKWSGSFVAEVDGETKDGTAFANFKQDGGTITGTAGPSAEEQYPIKKGTLEGGTLTLDVQSPDQLIHIVLTVDGDHMQGKAETEDAAGKKLVAKVDMKRQ